jgi:hypothetical protein
MKQIFLLQPLALNVSNCIELLKSHWVAVALRGWAGYLRW